MERRGERRLPALHRGVRCWFQDDTGVHNHHKPSLCPVHSPLDDTQRGVHNVQRVCPAALPCGRNGDVPVVHSRLLRELCGRRVHVHPLSLHRDGAGLRLVSRWVYSAGLSCLQGRGQRRRLHMSSGHAAERGV